MSLYVSLCPSQKSQYTGRGPEQMEMEISWYIHSITILYSILVFTSQSLLLLLLSMHSRSIVITSRTLASWRVMIRVIRTCNARQPGRSPLAVTTWLGALPRRSRHGSNWLHVCLQTWEVIVNDHTMISLQTHRSSNACKSCASWWPQRAFTGDLSCYFREKRYRRDMKRFTKAKSVLSPDTFREASVKLFSLSFIGTVSSSSCISVNHSHAI